MAISGAEQLVRESLATIAAQTANSAAFNVKDVWQIYLYRSNTETLVGIEHSIVE